MSIMNENKLFQGDFNVPNAYEVLKSLIISKRFWYANDFKKTQRFSFFFFMKKKMFYNFDLGRGKNPISEIYGIDGFSRACAHG